jgi:transposase
MSVLGVDRIDQRVIQALQPGHRIMRYELTDYEWTAIKPFLPNKPRGVPRVNDRRVLNGIFWVLRSGAPWRDLPDIFGPYTTCYNRFVRWRLAGVWARADREPWRSSYANDIHRVWQVDRRGNRKVGQGCQSGEHQAGVIREIRPDIP